MSNQLAKNQLAQLRRDRQSYVDTVEEYKARIPVVDAQIAALEPLAADEPAPAALETAARPADTAAPAA